MVLIFVHWDFTFKVCNNAWIIMNDLFSSICIQWFLGGLSYLAEKQGSYILSGKKNTTM